MAKATKPTEVTEVVLTMEQFKTLKKAVEDSGEVRRRLYNIDDADTVAKIAFAAGHAYSIADKLETDLISIVDEIDPYDDIEI
jgi:hypothetical protein